MKSIHKIFILFFLCLFSSQNAIALSFDKKYQGSWFLDEDMTIEWLLENHKPIVINLRIPVLFALEPHHLNFGTNILALYPTYKFDSAEHLCELVSKNNEKYDLECDSFHPINLSDLQIEFTTLQDNEYAAIFFPKLGVKYIYAKNKVSSPFSTKFDYELKEKEREKLKRELIEKLDTIASKPIRFLLNSERRADYFFKSHTKDNFAKLPHTDESLILIGEFDYLNWGGNYHGLTKFRLGLSWGSKGNATGTCYGRQRSELKKLNLNQRGKICIALVGQATDFNSRYLHFENCSILEIIPDCTSKSLY